MRLWLFLAVVAMLSACSSDTGPPRSAYYVVPFAPNDSGLGVQAKAVVAQAVQDIKGDTPAQIVLKGYIGPNDDGKALSEARLQTVEQALVSGGTAAALIHTTPTVTNSGTFERLGNGIVVQIQRGDLASPKPTSDE